MIRWPSSGGGNVNKIYFGALLELLLIIANIGTAVVIVPIMRRQFEELSIGYVTVRARAAARDAPILSGSAA